MNRNLSGQILSQKQKNGVEYLEFNCLSAYSEKLIHCISTKIGHIGNPSVKHAEASEHTRENFKNLADVIEIDYKNMVFANQVHEDNVRIVNYENRGEGVLRPRSQEGCDALMTVTPGTALVAFFADCVPILFYEPWQNAIAIAHAGWRGTVKKIAAKTVKEMVKQFGCNPENIIACIGPSIGRCCFEVETTVKNEFEYAFGTDNKIIEHLESGKYKVDLWKANIKQLIEKGLKQENIHSSGICTACNNDVLYSYRADGPETGRNYAVLQLI
ncbi:MAG: peptidoglycan editing factor PgeF [Ignavibacteriales bacterium]